MNRRTFLQTAALSTLAAASLPSSAQAQLFPRLQARRQTLLAARRGQTAQTRIPIGVQLYSVRGAAQRDLPGTLEAIAKMGYDGVEFAGYYGRPIEELRKMLDDNGLKCCGTHTGFGELRDDRFEQTAEIHEILGAKFIIVPGGLSNNDLARHTEWVNEFNRISAKAKERGLYIGYHAHGYDSNLLDGISSWQRFFDATAQEVVHQMDIGNFKDGGGDPYAMIERYPGRSRTVHLKEGGQRAPGNPIIGEGTVDWERAFELCETVGGTEWYIVEDEIGPNNLDRIERSIIALREMGK